MPKELRKKVPKRRELNVSGLEKVKRSHEVDWEM